MKKNIIITEQKINNIISQTLNEIAQKDGISHKMFSNWRREYIRILRNFGNNDYTKQEEEQFASLLLQHLGEIATTQTVASWVGKAINNIKKKTNFKYSIESVDPNKITHDVLNLVVTFFKFAFTGFDNDNIKRIAIKEKGEEKGKTLTDIRKGRIENSVDKKINVILKVKEKILNFVRPNFKNLMISVTTNNNPEYYTELQRLTRLLFFECYKLYDYVYGIEDSVILNQNSNMYDDKVNIKNDVSNPVPVFDALKDMIDQKHQQYSDISPDYSPFFRDVINWVDSNDNIVKQKFSDILANYRENTSVKDNEYLGMTKGIYFTLMAFYLGRYIPEMVRNNNIDTNGWSDFLTELEQVNNGIHDWDTLNQLTTRIVNGEDIRVMLYTLLQNKLKNYTTITYDNYIFELSQIFTQKDVKGGDDKGKTFAVKWGYSDGVEPKGIKLESYWYNYEHYFMGLGGTIASVSVSNNDGTSRTLRFKNLETFLREKLKQLNNENKSKPIIKCIYGIFYKVYKDFDGYLKEYIKQNHPTKAQINGIRKNLFIRVNNEIDNIIKEVNNGDKINSNYINNKAEKTNKNIKAREIVNNNKNIAESKIKQIIFESIKRYLK